MTADDEIRALAVELRKRTAERNALANKIVQLQEALLRCHVRLRLEDRLGAERKLEI